MARDGHIDLTLADVEEIALKAMRSHFLNERRYGQLLYALLGRIQNANKPIEVKLT